MVSGSQARSQQKVKKFLTPYQVAGETFFPCNIQLHFLRALETLDSSQPNAIANAYCCLSESALLLLLAASYLAASPDFVGLLS